MVTFSAAGPVALGASSAPPATGTPGTTSGTVGTVGSIAAAAAAPDDVGFGEPCSTTGGTAAGLGLAIGAVEEGSGLGLEETGVGDAAGDGLALQGPRLQL